MNEYTVHFAKQEKLIVNPATMYLSTHCFLKSSNKEPINTWKIDTKVDDRLTAILMK